MLYLKLKEKIQAARFSVSKGKKVFWHLIGNLDFFPVMLKFLIVLLVISYISVNNHSPDPILPSHYLFPTTSPIVFNL